MTTPPQKEKRKHADTPANETPIKRQCMTQEQYTKIRGEMDDKTRDVRREFFDSLPNALLFNDHAREIVEWIQGHDTEEASAWDRMMATSRFEFIEESASRMKSMWMYEHTRALLRALLSYCDRASLIREYADARRADIVANIACVEEWIATDMRE